MFMTTENYQALGKELAALQGLEKARTKSTAAAPVAADTTKLSLGMLALAVLPAGLVTFVVSRLIGQPILALTHVMTAFARGDKGTEIAESSRKDQIGRMAERLAAEREARRAEEGKRAERFAALALDFDRKVTAML